MSSIDNRVVKLVFDNSKFEKNASTSMKTLNNLKESLDFSGAVKGLDEIQKQVENTKFDSIETSLINLEKRFSPLGIAGMTIFSELTKAAMNFAATVAGKVTDSIVSGGAKRAFALENARFTLQGLTKDAETVNQVMEDALQSVKGTAYGYGDAASAASQLFASGIQAGEQMQTVLSGITGVAATTNSNYSEIAHIFTTIAGNGRLMTEQLNQFSYRGMNAAATLTDAFNQVLNGSSTLSEELQDHIRAAVEFGMSEVKEFGGSLEGITEGDLRALVSKGAIQFDMFAGIMSSTFGEHAFNANKTFNGAMENIQAALSRTGAMFYTELIAQEGPIVQLFNSVMKAIDSVNDGLKPVAEVWSRFVNSLADAGRIAIDTFSGNGGFNSLSESLRFFAAILERVWAIVSVVFFGVEGLDIPGLIGKIVEKFKSVADSLDISEDHWNTFRTTLATVKVVLEGVWNIFSSVLSVVWSFISALSEIYVLDQLSYTVYRIADGFRAFTESIKPSADQLDKLKNFFKGFFKLAGSVATIIVDVLSGAFGTLGTIFEKLTAGSDGLYDVLSLIGDVLYIAGANLKSFYDVISSRINLDPLVEGIGNLKDRLSNFINFDDLTSGFRDFVETLKADAEAGNFPLIDNLGETLDTFKAHIENNIPHIVEVFETFKNGVVEKVDFIKNEISSKIPEITIDFDTLKESIANLAKDIKNNLEIEVPSFFEKIKNVLETLKTKFQEVAPIVKEKVDEIRGSLANLVKGVSSDATKYEGLDIVGLLGIGGMAFAVKKIFDIFKKLKGGEGGGIIDGLMEIKDAVVDTFGSIQSTLKAGSLLAIAISIGVLAYSLSTVASIPTENLLGGLGAISVLVFEMKANMTHLGGLDPENVGQMIVTTASLVVFSYAIKNLAESIVVIGALSMESILKGITVVTILIAELIGVSKILNKEKSGMANGVMTLLGMATAVYILTKPIEMLGNMDQEKLKQGLAAVAILIAGLGAVGYALGKSGFGLSAAAGLIAMATSLYIMYGAVHLYANLDWAYFLDGLGKLGAVLAVLAGAGYVLGISNFGVSAGIGLIAMATSLFIMYGAIQLYKNINLMELASGLIKVGLALGVLVLAAALVGNVRFNASDGVGLMAIAAALVILAVGITMLASVPTLVVAASLAILFVALLAFGALAYVLAPVAPVLMQMAIAIGIFALSAVLISAALMLIVVALGAFGAAIVGFINTAASMVDPMLEAFTNFINASAEGIRNNQDQLLDAIGNLLLAFGEMLLNAFSKLGEFLTTTVWPWIQENGPAIVQGLIDGIVSLAGSLAEGAVMLFNAFVEGLAGIWPWIQENGPAIVQGLIDGILGFLAGIGEAAGKIFEEFCKAMDAFWPWLAENGPKIVTDLISGILSMLVEIGKAAGDLIQGLIDGLAEGVSDMLEAGANLVQGFVDGLLGAPQKIADAAMNMGNEALNGLKNFLGIASPSKEAMKQGQWFVQGFIDGIEKLKNKAAEETESVGLAVMNALDVGVDPEYHPTISPVMDLSNVQNGIGTMNSMFDSMPNTYNVNGSIGSMFNSVPDTYGINGAIDAQNMLNNQAMLSLGSGSDYGAIIQGMLNIQNDLAKYSEIMTKLNIVMDTGTLVGQLTPGIDRQLGRNAMMAGRGVL